MRILKRCMMRGRCYRLGNSFVEVDKDCKKVKVNINNLPIKDKLSYSRLDCFKSCEYKYKLKYINKNYTNDSSLALRIGTILHLGLEYKYLKKYNNEEILELIYKGCIDEGQEVIGLSKLKNEYPFEWEEEDKFGRTYDEKIELYKSRILEDIEDDWECIGCEVQFDILFENKSIIHGFIDRVDRHKVTGDMRVVDYKSSKKPYDKKDLATPLQMYVYALACKEIYGQFPSEFIYDMVLIGEKQEAMTKGWEKRGHTALSKLIDKLIVHNANNNINMTPKPSPLCHWCSYSETNPNATNGKGLCEYNLLWTPENKVWKKNKEWIEVVEEDDGWEDEWN